MFNLQKVYLQTTKKLITNCFYNSFLVVKVRKSENFKIDETFGQNLTLKT